jgi:hypothetical protein
MRLIQNAAFDHVNLFWPFPIDIYPTVLFRQVFKWRMAVGNCLIKLRMSP